MPVISETTLARGRLGHAQVLSSPGGHQPGAATSLELSPAFCLSLQDPQPLLPPWDFQVSSAPATGPQGGTLGSPGSSLALALICCSVSPPVLSETIGLLLPRMSRADISQQSGTPTVAQGFSVPLCHPSCSTLLAQPSLPWFTATRSPLLAQFSAKPGM